MGIEQQNFSNIIVRLAKDPSEVIEAQRLRYKVFYEEYDAVPNETMMKQGLDIEPLDDVADHLIVINSSNGKNQIVGTYRLLRHDVANKYGKFYTSDEFDIAPLLKTGHKLLELGRSCVLAEYRTRPVLQLLWEGISEYMLDHKIGMLFGCASLYGTDVNAISEQLAFLHHYYMAPEDWRPRALESRYVNMNLHDKANLNARVIFRQLPPLIRGYLRTGSLIGDGAVLDHQFNTTDVCIMLPLEKIAPRYRDHYSRKINRTIEAPKDTPSGKDLSQESISA